MSLVKDFESSTLDVSIINYAIIIIRKDPEENDMKKFSPISLGNCSHKVITKSTTNRLSPVGHRIISPNQTAFLKGGLSWKVWFLLINSFINATLVVIVVWFSSLAMKRPMVGLVGPS
jgi:hypothetical protein